MIFSDRLDNYAAHGKEPLTPAFRRLLWRVCKFLPVYIHHVLRQPYRITPTRGARRGVRARALVRHRAALFDGCLELILRAYSLTSGLRLRHGTGTVAVLLTRVAFAFDDEFERRRAERDDAEFVDIISSTALTAPLRTWRAFVEGDETYPSIRAFLFDHVAGLHQAYLRSAASAAEPHANFEAIMDRAVLDSGGLLVLLAHVVALYQQSEAPAEVLDQFSALGVAGKLADDMTDFRKDVLGDRPNALWALTLRFPSEHAAVVAALESQQRLTATWWRRNCPQTFRAFMTSCEQSHQALQCDSLRTVWAMIWLPARLGHSPETESRGRL
jgi:hypothetical protein